MSWRDRKYWRIVDQFEVPKPDGSSVILRVALPPDPWTWEQVIEDCDAGFIRASWITLGRPIGQAQPRRKFPESTWRDLFARDGNICGICGLTLLPHSDWGGPSDLRVQIDHRMPRWAGGPHELANLQLAHPQCNNQKNGHIPDRVIVRSDGTGSDLCRQGFHHYHHIPAFCGNAEPTWSCGLLTDCQGWCHCPRQSETWVA